jgi:hypothetical protein
MAEKTFSYSIETEIPSNYFGNLMDFTYQKYILPQRQRFANVSQKVKD